MNVKKAFTLAEVLITLGIIGIIAAMTLPSVITNYQKKQAVAQLKKFYSIMLQAVKLSESYNSDVKYWNFTIGGNNHTEIFMDTYIKPYIKVIKEYKPEDFPADINYKCVSGSDCNAFGQVKNNNPKLVLADGTMILAADLATGLDDDGKTVHMMNIIVDLNGFKKPNQYGRDVFAFTIQPGTGFAPAGIGYTSAIQGSQNYDREWFSSGGNGRGCNRRDAGFYCAALIMTDGWEMKEDYPW